MVITIIIGMLSDREVFAFSELTYAASSTGIDLSWPSGNCHASTELISSWGIVGVNGGLDFSGNPCLKAEASRLVDTTLYANTGYDSSSIDHKFLSSPKQCTPGDGQCLAYNYGYNAGKFAVTYAASQDVHSAMWWLDVENDNTWSTNVMYNRASIRGESAAIKRYTVIGYIGIYAYPGQWDAITGRWRNMLPSWVATGTSERNVAIAFCNGQDFTGGGTWLTQYTLKLDQDYVC